MQSECVDRELCAGWKFFSDGLPVTESELGARRLRRRALTHYCCSRNEEWRRSRTKVKLEIYFFVYVPMQFGMSRASRPPAKCWNGISVLKFYGFQVCSCKN